MKFRLLKTSLAGLILSVNFITAHASIIIQEQDYLFNESFQSDTNINNHYSYFFNGFDSNIGNLERVNLFINMGIEGTTSFSASSQEGVGESHWLVTYDSLINSIGAETIDAPLGSDLVVGHCSLVNENVCVQEVISSYFSNPSDSFGFNWINIPIDSFLTTQPIEIKMSSVAIAEHLEVNNGAAAPDTKYGNESGVEASMFGDVSFYGSYRLEYHYTESNTPSTDVPEPSTVAILALGMIGFASRRFKKQS